MDTSWPDWAAMDPGGIALIAAAAVLGVIATVVVLVRQSDPRTPDDRERIARRRERSRRLAH